MTRLTDASIAALIDELSAKPAPDRAEVIAVLLVELIAAVRRDLDEAQTLLADVRRMLNGAPETDKRKK